MANEQPQSPLFNWSQLWMMLALLLVAIYLFNSPKKNTVADLPYSSFKSHLADNAITRVEMQGNRILGEFREPQYLERDDKAFSEFQTRVPATGDDRLLDQLEARGVVLVVRDDDENSTLRAILSILPWVLLLLYFFWLSRRTMGQLSGKGSPLDFSRQLEAQIKGDIPDTTFEDVAGQDNAKQEVQELIEFLRNPEQFRSLGAEVPHGILLMGPPGTGKTLMAKALAGEAGVRFYPISASEFIEVFVGVGASRVRQLFETARKNTPSIIFIDELDSIGRTRGTGLGGGHDEREQTLNQILAEMDGFAGHEAVIVLAATNRPDVLDPALLRPGRFDRHVTLDLPDLKGRVAILTVHTRHVPLDPTVDLSKIAAGTPGFSGADLKNLVNEAAMAGARTQSTAVTMANFDEARDKIILGTARSLVISAEEKHRLAVHESGHTLVAHFLPNADPLYKVSIVPRGQALGGTHQLPVEERHTYSEDYLKDRLAVMLGGRAAEKLLLGTVSSGADDDIHQATQLARSMVSRWGMSDEVGPVDLRASEGHPFLGREIAQPRHYSEHAAKVVDDAVQQLLLSAQNTAMDLIEAHKPNIETLITRLEQEETLHQQAIEECLGSSVPRSFTTISGSSHPVD
ncbi:ATP-dependent zinc metalloprotease FtsH [Marinobacter zhejiangensis]|uniref:ATP-dependent zinc metalloprotease FtsH n=1 Tax=Marinobacter zhejiangensis TaxID=488535 RepID=A0A1I4NG14_9GAMM|nr:ATP-dependent zinc metalloprotease FtsH [Marinobacter zhejiangensis]SFM14484.1 cell division protease FtsH [Marinobacter zhejiangensis]